MDKRAIPWSERVYRALLRLFPFDFRGEFEEEMQETFREQHRDARRRGDRIGLFRLWWDTITGIFTTAPAEHYSILRQDTGYALRMMNKNRSFTAVAVVTLALGIGANTAIVSVIDAVLLKPLPYQRDGQLVMLHQNAGSINDIGFSAKEVNDYREQTKSFSELVEFHSMTFTLLSKDEATRVRSGVVSYRFFRMFGVRPILGRDFQPEDDQPDAPPVLLLSYEYWRQHEHGDPNIVGKTYEMNDRAHTVVGVLPPVPQYPNENEVYMPTSACPFRSNPRTVASRTSRMVNLFGRLKPGVTLERAQADLSNIAGLLSEEYPEAYQSDGGVNAVAVPLRKELTENAKPMLLVLMGAAICVLLIACANVANLTLARMGGRERELVVRAALGAGKGRLLRQLFTESLLMAILAAGLGVLFASQSLRLLVEFTARLTPRAREIQVDSHMLLFALAGAVLTSLVSGTVSALHSRDDLSGALKEGSGLYSAGRRRVFARDLLVISQVAFSFILLIGAGLMLRSLSKLSHVDPGFVPQRVLAMRLALNWSKFQAEQQRREFAAKLVEKLRKVPGVQFAATSSSYPMDTDAMSFGGWTAHVIIEGHPEKPGDPPPRTMLRSASSDYFQTLGIPLLKGRTFHDTDNPESQPVAIVNETLAHHYWPGQDPLGKRVSISGADRWANVVGVVGDVKEAGLDRETSDELYFALAQVPVFSSVLVRTIEDSRIVFNEMRRAVRALEPDTAIPMYETLEDARSESMASSRVMTDLLGIFAGLALIIAASGIGAILALSVNQRLNEIGIRLALGANPARVLAMVLGHGMMLVAIGLAIGLASSLALTGMMRKLLFQIEPTDPATFIVVSAVLALAAFVAAYLPARRALRIDPLLALRRE